LVVLFLFKKKNNHKTAWF